MIRKVRASCVVLLLFSLVSCASAPRSLSPVGVQDYNNTRVIKALDLVRDTAVDANAQIPQLLSEAATRKIVTYHRSALVTINATKSGWRSTVLAGLDEAVKDLPPQQAALVAPYVALVKTIVQEVSR